MVSRGSEAELPKQPDHHPRQSVHNRREVAEAQEGRNDQTVAPEGAVRDEPHIGSPDPKKDSPAIINRRVDIEIGREHDPGYQMRSAQPETARERCVGFKLDVVEIETIRQRRKRRAAEHRDEIVRASRWHTIKLGQPASRLRDDGFAAESP